MWEEGFHCRSVECPVCSCAVPQRSIDSHIDLCLLRGEKKESLRSSGVKPNTLLEEAPPKKPSPKSSAVSTEQEDKATRLQTELSSCKNLALKFASVSTSSSDLETENLRPKEACNSTIETSEKVLDNNVVDYIKDSCVLKPLTNGFVSPLKLSQSGPVCTTAEKPTSSEQKLALASSEKTLRKSPPGKVQPLDSYLTVQALLQKTEPAKGIDTTTSERSIEESLSVDDSFSSAVSNLTSSFHSTENFPEHPESNSALKPSKVLGCSPTLPKPGPKENISSTEMREYQRASPEPGTTGSEPSSPKPGEEVTKGKEEPMAGSSHSDVKGTANKDGGPNLITAAMLEEEEKLHKELEEEEKVRMEKAKEQWDKSLKEQRFSRLTHLLKKSNTYTEFLLKRMERQAEEAKRKAEARRKRAQKQEEKKRSKEPASQQVSVRRSDRRGANSQPTTGSPVKSTSKSPRGSKTADKIKTEPEETAGPSEDGKQAKKRKREDDSEYCLADYISKEELEKKKLKVEEQVVPEVLEEVSVPRSIVQIMEKEKPADTFRRVIDGKPVSDRQPELFSGGVLREYQLQGMDWMKVLYENGVNGILADEMGLGKTVQCIALFAELIGEGMIGPFMIVAPLSTLSNWYSEFRRFSPKVPVLIYHGNLAQRTKLRRKIFRVHGELGVHPIVITSYEITMRDSNFLAVHHWKYIIVDEGHRIKNLNCRLIREIKKIPTANKILLTGTPLQNNLSELWSLLNYLLPEVFDDLGSFEEWFDFTSIGEEGGEEKIVEQEQEKNVLGMLHQVLTPFVLRRLKTDVDLNIPPKKELLVYAPLTSHQQKFYKGTMDRTIIGMLKDNDEKPLELSDKGRPKRRAAKKVDYQLMMENDGDDKQSEEGMLEWVEKVAEAYKREVVEAAPKSALLNLNLKNIMMQLRKICNHPYLIEYPLDPATQDYLVDERLVESSGKLLLLDKMLPMLRKDGHKILIFSQMTKMMDVLEDYCLYRQHKYCRLDGTMAYQDRQDQIDLFNKDPEYFVFLLSTRAGGLGINLTAADTVIIYDSDWNPQCDLQAQDRCHRIGQTRPVVVYRLITANTIDQRIVERAAGKRKLEKMVMHKGKFKGGESGTKKSQSLIDPHELMELLKSQDHDVVRDCNEVISAKALSTLLDRSDLIARYSENMDEVEKQKKGKVNHKVAKEVPGLFKVIEEEPEGTELKIL
ncbi:lymphoid-specific helicase-like isoform X2 [Branchiostoma lanceolatum]|uniref:lymphoid-specific helicase-like isoform X2 n=1 Tax=Branchiostoma lanceolatum TaxID=7740 RepID=UPI0034565D8C